MIDTAIFWVKRLFVIGLFVAIGWWGVTHAAQVAGLLVTVIGAGKTFGTTLADGIGSLFS
ncbi:hypothetical protein L6E12_21045 [Actinokineospora sp. PR83]|uniref:hypothetical protein n=1 Tax=Actinokineospora sp. PR83 TaxID=2884908 RepID=UPI001F2DBF73|nr:hypothetical protein [Actinokineospora sp. PR83]MCG8918273.1 hypothetical protein [Actinokineospora sp. PR83]